MKLLIFISTFFIVASCQSNPAKISVAGEDTFSHSSIQELGTLSIDLPTTWRSIPNDSMPQSPDMTARYWIRTSTGDTIFLLQGFSAWDLSADDSIQYVRTEDTLFGRRAIKFNSKARSSGNVGVFVDSVGEEKQVGYYGFTAYATGLPGASVDTFWKVVRTIKLHPLK